MSWNETKNWGNDKEGSTPNSNAKESHSYITSFADQKSLEEYLAEISFTCIEQDRFFIRNLFKTD